MRVTSDLATAGATGIAAITSTTAAARPTTGWEGTAPRGEGRTTSSLLSPPLVVTCCRLGLHSSCMGGRAMLNPISIWPLSNKYRSVTLKKLKL